MPASIREYTTKNRSFLLLDDHHIYTCHQLLNSLIIFIGSKPYLSICAIHIRNCEDIAMSFLVANATGAPPIWVKGK